MFANEADATVHRLQKPFYRLSWSDDVVFLLLRLIKEKKIVKEIDGVTQRNRKIYDDLSGELEKRGYPGFHTLSCRNKWKNLKKIYFEHKRRQVQGDLKPAEWVFFKEMDKLMSRLPKAVEICENAGVSVSDFEISDDGSDGSNSFQSENKPKVSPISSVAENLDVQADSMLPTMVPQVIQRQDLLGREEANQKLWEANRKIQILESDLDKAGEMVAALRSLKKEKQDEAQQFPRGLESFQLKEPSVRIADMDAREDDAPSSLIPAVGESKDSQMQATSQRPTHLRPETLKQSQPTAVVVDVSSCSFSNKQNSATYARNTIFTVNLASMTQSNLISVVPSNAYTVVGSHLCDIGNVVASQKFSKVSDSATTTQMVAVSNTISNVASGSDSEPQAQATVVRANTAVQKLENGSLGDDEETRLKKQDILQATEQMIQYINSGDFVSYAGLCAPGHTCFDPMSMGNLLTGNDFHKYLFALPKDIQSRKSIILSPHTVLLNSDCGYIAYICLTSFIDNDGKTHSIQTEETRVWRRVNRNWKNTHLHRSQSTSAKK